MTHSNAGKKNKLGSFSLAMLTVAAIISLRNLPASAEYGIASISLLVIAAVLFFIPIALVTAELASTWPKAGGSYAWVSEAFGKKVGFFSLWWAWMESIAWFPAILAFTSKMFWAVMTGIWPHIGESNLLTFVTILSIFWGATILNFYGIRTSSILSSVGVMLGTIIPGSLIVLLGAWWCLSGHPVELAWNTADLVPDLQINNLVLFSGIILSFAGVELAAFHVRETAEPKRDFPKALLLAVIIILILSVLGSLTIACVVPKDELHLIAGVLQVFRFFLDHFNLAPLLPVIAFCLFLGSLAGINAWTVGPAKGMLVCAEDGFLPNALSKVNSNGAPVNLLILQATVGSILTLVFLYLPTDSASYWILTALSAIFTVGQYCFIFCAALRLRYTQPNSVRPFRVPGGWFGIWLCVVIGVLLCLGTFVLGFLPPTQISTGDDTIYTVLLISAFVGLSIPPLLMIRHRSKTRV